jgi:hypothetical protein
VVCCLARVKKRNLEGAIELCIDPGALFKETLIQRMLLWHLYAVKGNYDKALEVQSLLLSNGSDEVLTARKSLLYHLAALSGSLNAVPNE